MIELADAVIRILDYCAYRGWDLENAIKIKMEFNSTRPYRHGGEIEMTKYKYGVMSSVFTLEAPDNLTAIAAMIFHYSRQPHMVVVYEPKDVPVWCNFTGKTSARLDEIFQERGGFDKFVTDNIGPIKSAMNTIVRIAG